MNTMYASQSPMQERSTAIPVTPAIAIALENLEKELHLAKEMMQVLNQRLMPIMRPPPINDPSKNIMPSCGGSLMFNHIDSMATLAKSLVDDARSIVDCLEV